MPHKQLSLINKEECVWGSNAPASLPVSWLKMEKNIMAVSKMKKIVLF